MNLSQIASLLSAIDEGTNVDINLEDISRFLRLARRLLGLRPELYLRTPGNGLKKITEEQSRARELHVLATLLGWDIHYASSVWVALQDEILRRPIDSWELGLTCDDKNLLDNGLVSVGTINPPLTTCHTKGCGHRTLIEKEAILATVFTLRRGPLPITCTSYYCRGCKTRYYNNYFISAASSQDAVREYYGGVPMYIEVTDHIFVEDDLCVWISQMFTFPQSSAVNTARVYNFTMSPFTEEQSRALPEKTVLDSFFIHSLLYDKLRREEKLEVPHHGLQSDRFLAALWERNSRMAGCGQEQWAHACFRCMKIFEDDNGTIYRMTGVVIDGVTVHHPCCSVHDCKLPLTSQAHHFCELHKELRKQCTVSGCTEDVEAGFRTCPCASHRELENNRQDTTNALFQFRSRLQDLSLVSDPEMIPGPTHESAPLSRSKRRKSATQRTTNADETIQKPTLKVHRRWTNNEQLCVRPCGMIIGRATFYGSEGVAAVKDFLNVIFPLEMPGALPSYVFYDNNCSLTSHLIAANDTTLLGRVGLPVDVFHFKSHSINDRVCQQYCNPARFPELVDKDNSWRLNSSAAEQSNVWFGGFRPIVREMLEVRHNFFLDEMIMIRNRFIVKQLKREGMAPHIVPECVLRSNEPTEL